MHTNAVRSAARRCDSSVIGVFPTIVPRIASIVSIAVLLAAVLLAGCVVDDLKVEGRQCGADRACGPGTLCDFSTQTCIPSSGRDGSVDTRSPDAVANLDLGVTGDHGLLDAPLSDSTMIQDQGGDTPPPQCSGSREPRPWAFAPPGCDPLPPATGSTLRLEPSQAPQLPALVAMASSGTTILLADGTYPIGDDAPLVFDKPDVTLRSERGIPSCVVLDAGFSAHDMIRIQASNVTITALTLQRSSTDGAAIRVTGGASADTLDTRIHAIRLIDPAGTGILIEPSAGFYADQGEVACSHFDVTDRARTTPSGCASLSAVRGIGARDWRIEANTLTGFWCAGTATAGAIQFSHVSRDTIVVRNILRDVFSGIVLGARDAGDGSEREYVDPSCTSAGYLDFTGGLIANNFVFAGSAQPGLMTGIGTRASCAIRIAYNTVAATAETDVGAAFRVSGARTNGAFLFNNLGTHPINVANGANTLELNNMTEADLATTFVDPLMGDLHLRADASSAIRDSGLSVPALVEDDIDTEPRAAGTPDIGADEL